MADKYIDMNGNMIKLYDNKDGTFSFIKSFDGVATGGSVTTLKDTKRDFGVDTFNDKYVIVNISGKDYMRKITDTVSDGLVFGTLVASVAAVAVLEKTGGGKVTITCANKSAVENDYVVRAVQGEEVNTVADFADGVLLITLGVNATAANVHAVVDVLAEFSSVVTTAGAIIATTEDIAFTGGVTEVKVLVGNPYSIIL